VEQRVLERGEACALGPHLLLHRTGPSEPSHGLALALEDALEVLRGAQRGIELDPNLLSRPGVGYQDLGCSARNPAERALQELPRAAEQRRLARVSELALDLLELSIEAPRLS
jgi:hypothetical protein